MDELLSWFCLKSVPGVGNHLFKRLINRFNLPDSVFRASAEDLLQVEGITARQVSAIQNFKTPDSVKQELEQVGRNKIKVTTLTDSAYPALLREIPDPPHYLYVCGNLDGSPRNIAVVGSRNPTEYGISTTQKLCADLSAFGLRIISGMAVGIDSAAHQGALAGKGRTIAVLGSGLNHIYPSENLSLFNRICENGAVVSEFALDTAPEAHNFPRVKFENPYLQC